jgi:two-component system, OmpR family, response regulator
MRVLIVDDEVPFALSLQRGLAADGTQVDVVNNGNQGLLAATAGDYDVVVLDVMLPGIDGQEVVRRLRHRGVWVPVLMLTARDGDADQEAALDLGADDYLTKPFSLRVLQARLRAMTRRTTTGRPAPLAVGDLVLDPAAKAVRRAGREIALTPREFALLEYLMQRPGEVVSKSELHDSVWDSDFDSPLNVVEVYVGYLRRKIDGPFGVRSLATVRGFGYRIDPVQISP